MVNDGAGMYHVVRPSHRSKKSTILWLSMAVCILLLAMVIIPAVWGGWYQQRYWDYVGDLSSATSHAYAHGCLMAEFDGGHVRVKGDAIYQPYQLMTAMGRGRPADPPERTADLVLDYGEGSRLFLWEVPPDSRMDGRDCGLLIRFESAQGRSISYDTSRLTLGIMFSSLGLERSGL